MAAAQSAKPERTVVVYGIPDGVLRDDVMADILMINFQKTKNNGGDVEDVAYPISTKGAAYITFEDKEVAENVLRKGKLILEDKRLREDYTLKVSSYGQSVFTCVTCIINLSTFGDKYNLEELVQELERNIPSLSFGPLCTTGQITVQGPFSAIKSLQNRLALNLKHSPLKQIVKRKESMPDNGWRMKPRHHGLSFTARNDAAQIPNEEGVAISFDTDIYHYMKRFNDKLYRETLEKCNVTSDEYIEGEVTTIFLCVSNADLGPSQLEHAKNIIEGLLAELHCSLRKERLSQKGFSRMESWRYKQAYEVVSSHFPNVLVIPFQTHIDIIGSSSDIYEFVQEMNKIVETFQKKSWSLGS